MAISMRRPLVAGNWKMNGLRASTAELGKIVKGSAALTGKADLMICPPATLIMSFVTETAGSAIEIGGEDCHAEPFGAFTGDISAEMLADAGATAIIVGHSERRTLHQETDAEVRAKVRAVWRAGLTAIVCIGEKRAEREAGLIFDVLGRQLDGSIPDGATAAKLVVAYEPVWAIGTGKVATTDQAQEVHAFIRGLLTKLFTEPVAQRVRILYGGSMKPANAPELLAQKDIDGGLIGGASLEARSFVELVNAATAAR
jgi:triosephosphate isomerase